MPSRRELLAGATAVALAGCTGSDERDPDLSGEWRQVGRDRGNRNHAPGVTLPSRIVESWRGNVGSWPYVPSVVADGTVYAAGSRGTFAFDAAGGAQRWHRGIDGDVAAALALADDALLVPEYRREGPGASNGILAVDPADGSYRWATELETRPFAPTLADGRAYLRTRDACVAVADGELLWRTELDRLVYDEFHVWDSTDFTSTIGPAVTDAGVVVPDRDAVVALDPADGSERWRVPLGGSMASPVAVDGAVLAVGVGSTVSVGDDGRERWRVDRGGWATLAAAADEAYLAADELTALALGDGRRAWDAPAHGDVQRSQPAVLGDGVLSVGDGGVAVLREDPGLFDDRELFEIDARAADHGGVAVGGGRVFVVDGSSGDLVAYEAAE